MTQRSRLREDVSAILADSAGTTEVEPREERSPGAAEPHLVYPLGPVTDIETTSRWSTPYVGATDIYIGESGAFTTQGPGTSVIDEMQTEIEQLKARVAALEEEVNTLKAEEEVIVLRTVTRGQAKQEIQELFQSGETLFYSDIARRLGMDLPLVVEICQELQEEGEIEINADAV